MSCFSTRQQQLSVLVAFLLGVAVTLLASYGRTKRSFEVTFSAENADSFNNNSILSVSGSGRSEGVKMQQTTLHSIPARAFSPWPIQQRPLPCFSEPQGGDLLDAQFQERTNATRGFLYQKTPKCASTTSAGVNLRIARNVAQRMNLPNITMCDNRWTHGRRRRLYATRFQNRSKSESFLWTIVRDPTERYLSHFFWGPMIESVQGNEIKPPTARDFQKWLRGPRHYPYFYNCILSTKRQYRCDRSYHQTERQAVEELTQILHEYDFVGLAERYDESMVVLMLLLNIPMADIIVFRSKSSGSGYAVHRGCLPIPPKYTPDDIREYFESSEWRERIQTDELFHQAVNRSLDLTIDQLGRDVVERNVKRYRKAQEVVSRQCEGRVVMPCKEYISKPREGDETDCMYQDIGCGMECLDDVSTELSLW